MIIESSTAKHTLDHDTPIKDPPSQTQLPNKDIDEDETVVMIKDEGKKQRPAKRNVQTTEKPG